MNNDSLSGASSDISVPQAKNHLGREQSDLITTEANTHNPVKYTYNSTDPAFECVFLMEEEDAEREPPPKLSATPPLSPAVTKPIRGSKQPVKQKRGRFLVWPVHFGQPLDFTSS
eukprot:CAMPEP_0119014250 /NCGR_PEP_ID=MMETSP1176-20130426/9437_1 /TAXON_ID=265551 /ORGANISM="Synedropsis recta cf, Strain CCMP1620" /LENGTH=114 /DNA_ID=CAMNT_0006967405 /DNA_START=94 /DNA_END=438 /DNA_ORIENTATION=-